MSTIYRVEFSKMAVKSFNQLDKLAKHRVATAIKKLAQENLYPNGCKKMVDSDNQYRIRVGDYRIIYKVRASIITIYIVDVGHRKEIYK